MTRIYICIQNLRTSHVYVCLYATIRAGAGTGLLPRGGDAVIWGTTVNVKTCVDVFRYTYIHTHKFGCILPCSYTSMGPYIPYHTIHTSACRRNFIDNFTAESNDFEPYYHRQMQIIHRYVHMV